MPPLVPALPSLLLGMMLAMLLGVVLAMLGG